MAAPFVCGHTHLANSMSPKRNALVEVTPPDPADFPLCPLCGRPIPPDAQQSVHHLVPKLKGGRRGATVLLHQICHNEIHSVLTEVELARVYNTVEALREHPALGKFIAWVAKKDPYFHSRTVGNHRKKKPR